MNSKRKGNLGELELLHLLEAAGLDVQRNQQAGVGGIDNPDIALQHKGRRYHLEVKRKESLSVYQAMEQAIADANGHAVPLVVHRRNRKPWIVIMRLGDFLGMICGGDG